MSAACPSATTLVPGCLVVIRGPRTLASCYLVGALGQQNEPAGDRFWGPVGAGGHGHSRSARGRPPWARQSSRLTSSFSPRQSELRAFRPLMLRVRLIRRAWGGGRCDRGCTPRALTGEVARASLCEQQALRCPVACCSGLAPAENSGRAVFFSFLKLMILCPKRLSARSTASVLSQSAFSSSVRVLHIHVFPCYVDFVILFS